MSIFKFYKLPIVIFTFFLVFSIGGSIRAESKKKVITVPYLYLALELKERTEKYEGSWGVTQIVINGKKLTYNYKYTGFHPDPFFRRKIDKEIELSAKDTSLLIQFLEKYNLLKNVIYSKPSLEHGDSFMIQMFVKLGDIEAHTKMSGIFKDLVTDSRKNPTNYDHYRSIDTFVSYVRDFKPTKQD